MSNLSPRTPEPGSAEAVKSRAFDDATPLRRPRRSFRQTLVVLDPWIAISASIPWLFAVYALKSGADFQPSRDDDGRKRLVLICMVLANRHKRLVNLHGRGRLNHSHRRRLRSERVPSLDIRDLLANIRCGLCSKLGR